MNPTEDLQELYGQAAGLKGLEKREAAFERLVEFVTWRQSQRLDVAAPTAQEVELMRV